MISYERSIYTNYDELVAIMPGPKSGVGTYLERKRYYNLLVSILNHTSEPEEEVRKTLQAALPENPHIGHYYKALYSLVCPCKDCDGSRYCHQHCNGGVITAADTAAFSKGGITGKNKSLAERLKEYKRKKQAAIEEIWRAEKDRLEKRNYEYSRALNKERHRRNPRVEPFDNAAYERKIAEQHQEFLEWKRQEIEKELAKELAALLTTPTNTQEV